MSARIGAILTITAVSLTATGCLERELSPLNPCAQQGTDQQVRINNVEKVDVLFVVDNSGSMAEEQRALREQLPRLVGVLATGDLEFGQPGDPAEGIRDFSPVRDLHVGVISTDMGTGGFQQDTCDEPLFGDDGILQNRGNPARDPELDCASTYDRFLSFENPDGDRCAPDEEGNLPAECQDFADAFQCVSALGTEGCGFEQQLESTLKALMSNSPSCVQPYCNFFMGTRGQGNDPSTNGGFLRPDSLLAILVLTDEEDCSAADLDLFNTRSSRYFGNLNIRCTEFPTALHPIERYVDGLLSLRPDPQLLVYSVIAGVPTQLIRNTTDSETGRQNFDAMLADPSMSPRPNSNNTGLEPSCRSANGEADPPRRFVQLARDLQARGANSVVQSICAADYTPALDQILERIARVLGESCLPRPLNPDAAGRVNCNVLELLPESGDVTRCDQLPGRNRIGQEGNRELCEVVQVPATNQEVREDQAGWFYDDFTTGLDQDCSRFETQQRIAYIPGSEPETGTEVRLQCLQSVLSSSDEGGSGMSADLGAACMPFPQNDNGTPEDPSDDFPGLSACNAVQSPNFQQSNICDPSLRECQAPCESTADCAPGYLCDNSRLTIEDRSSPIITAAPEAGCGDLGTRYLPDPANADRVQCVSCVAPYAARVTDGEPPLCVRPCATDTDCNYPDPNGLDFGVCIQDSGVCSLPRICLNPTCQ